MNEFDAPLTPVSDRTSDVQDASLNQVGDWASMASADQIKKQNEAHQAALLKAANERAEAAAKAAEQAQRKLSRQAERQQNQIQSISAQLADSSVFRGGDIPASKGAAGRIATAQKYLGTPYVWGGNSLTKGVDCSGYVQQVWKRHGINLPRTAAMQSKVGQQVSFKNAKPGDRLYFTNKSGRVSHTGIYAGNGYMLEAPYTGAKVRHIKVNRPVYKVMRD